MNCRQLTWGEFADGLAITLFVICVLAALEFWIGYREQKRVLRELKRQLEELSRHHEE